MPHQLYLRRVDGPGRARAASPRKRFPARKLGLADFIAGLADSSRHLDQTELGRCRMIGRSGYAARYRYGSAVTVPLSSTSVYSFNYFRKSSFTINVLFQLEIVNNKLTILWGIRPSKNA